ncbi:hypothetical protein AB0H83_41405 [Dactylosporangium sp. NPDC050688]|uniref:hypothetical protein n=1 Tax=Dactylosporangium sp. NPDC050688 TaxID=3157217 RepID=UPI0033C49BE0
MRDHKKFDASGELLQAHHGQQGQLLGRVGAPRRVSTSSNCPWSGDHQGLAVELGGCG